MSRRKGPALAAPSTYAEAVAIAEAYGSEERRIANIRAFTEKRIAEVKAAADAEIAKTAEGQSMRFAQLKAWWAVAQGDVAKGKKSFAIGGIVLGDRTSTPKLGFLEKRKEADALAWLRALRWIRSSVFVRTKHELDKPAILKALAEGKADAAMLKAAFKTVQKDEFFIAVGEPAAKPIVETEDAS